MNYSAIFLTVSMFDTVNDCVYSSSNLTGFFVFVYYQVMINSGMLSESTPSSSTIEAPLAITIPVFHSSTSPNEVSQTSYSMQGSSIIFPVTVQRQTLPTIPSTEGIEANRSAGGNVANKRKRNPKPWSEEEDMQLRAAVQKFGEGNWATMLKSDGFPNKRSAVQLAQVFF